MRTFPGKTIPLDLEQYRKVSENLTENKNEISAMEPSAVLHRDCRGRIVSVGFYTVDGELYKQVFFDGDNITSVQYYRYDKLSRREEDEEDRITDKYIYKKDGNCAYEIHYEYDGLKRITGINKINKNNEISVTYQYDSLDRIVNRKMYLNRQLFLNQQYAYDVLNRVIEYKDENQRIVVESISKKNELISYSITDKIGNEITVKNHITETGYVDTEFSLNGHCVIVKDANYADNVMLKRPNANEDDLDLIISGLYNTQVKTADRRVRNIVSENSTGLIDKNIELKILPISIRKRVLYNIASKSEA